MNETKFTPSQVTEWAQFATIVFNNALEQTQSNPEFIEWAERVEARQAANPQCHQWSRSNLVRQWLDANPPTYPEPPVQRPSWASKLIVDPMRDHSDFYEWNISWEGKVGDAMLSQGAAIHDDHELTVHALLIRIEGEEETVVDGADLDRVIETLTAVRDALNS